MTHDKARERVKVLIRECRDFPQFPWLEDFIEQKETERRAPTTLVEYLSQLRDFFTWLQENGNLPIDRKSTNKFLLALGDGWQPQNRVEPKNGYRPRSEATIQKFARTIRVFTRFCADEGYIEPYKVTIPAINHEQDRPALTFEQVEKINRYLGSLRHRDRLWFWFVLETGCRVGEALNVTWADINLERRTVRIRVSKTGPREVSIDTIFHVLPDVLKGDRDKSGPVIYTKKKGEKIPLTQDGYRSFIDRLNREIDLGEVQTPDGHTEPFTFTPHDLRRTFITLALNQVGIPIPSVAAQVGHKNWTTTQKYDKTEISQLVDVFANHR